LRLHGGNMLIVRNFDDLIAVRINAF